MMPRKQSGRPASTTSSTASSSGEPEPTPKKGKGPPPPPVGSAFYNLSHKPKSRKKVDKPRSRVRGAMPSKESGRPKQKKMPRKESGRPTHPKKIPSQRMPRRESGRPHIPDQQQKAMPWMQKSQPTAMASSVLDASTKKGPPPATCIVGAFGNTISLSNDTPDDQQRSHSFELSTGHQGNYYYECQLFKLPTNATVGVGFMLESDNNTFPADTLPGWQKNTVGMHTDDGGIYLGGPTVAHVSRTFKEGDVIGVGHHSRVGFYVFVNGSRIWRERSPSSSSGTSSSSSSGAASSGGSITSSTTSTTELGFVGMDHKQAVVVLNKMAEPPVQLALA